MLNSWKKIPQIKRHAIVGAIICLGMLIYSFFAVDSVLDFMSRTVIMMLFASALNIILGFGGLRPLGMATYFGMAPMPTLSLSSAWLGETPCHHRRYGAGNAYFPRCQHPLPARKR